MITETSEPLKDTDFSPQVWRILRLAAVEASANRNERGDKICPEHILVAMLQDGTGAGFELISRCGLTVSDLRGGQYFDGLVPVARKTSLPNL
jgi:ATP-dependent Clp protease ATP-binding subunit ClpA